MTLLSLVHNQEKNWLAESRNWWAQSKLKKSKTSWIETADRKQLEWAFNYLEKLDQAYYWSYPHDDRDYATWILYSLDIIHERNAFEAKARITDMKNAWSMKKYRESEKAKKLTGIALSNNAKRMLKQLGKEDGKSSSEIIEKLLSEKIRTR